jgi:hypothetical protein
MTSCKRVAVPMEINEEINEKLQHDNGVEKADSKSFKILVSSLTYLTNTRLYIVYSVSLISRFIKEPTKLHFVAAKRILYYLQIIKNLGSKYEKQEDKN